MKRRLNRRAFLQNSARLAAAAELAGVARGAKATPPSAFISDWAALPDRVWIGPEYWSNPLQDWRIAGGRLECIRAALDRNVHVLTRAVGERPGSIRMAVRVGRVGGGPIGQGKGSFGFRVGVQGPLKEYRNSLIFGRGIDAGLESSGRLFIGIAPRDGAKSAGLAAEKRIDVGGESIELRLVAEPKGGASSLSLTAHEPASGKVLGEVQLEDVAADLLTGNLTLVANFPRRPKPRSATADAGRFWFDRWTIEGDRVETFDDRAFGPILFSQYTLSGGILKLSVQMPPIGEKDPQEVRLQIRNGEDWKTLAEASIHPEARTASFRIDGWDDSKEVAYRLAYSLRVGKDRTEDRHWGGTIRKDPKQADVLTVADVSCNMHSAFPNPGYVANLAKLDPDLIAFTGDQFYEPSGGYGIQKAPLDAAILDVLRKWYLHGWTWREQMKDRPSLSIPDDHDVYQGNLWGEGGEPTHGKLEMGGYQLPAAWVNVVHRTQTSHHPDPYDPTPSAQGISVYYGAMTYGRISFAVIADRQFKSGPEGKVPPTGSRGDHVISPDFDPKTADVPGLTLLGARQLAFLRDWAADWRGADMKAVVSQTIFTAMATTHGPKREWLRADYDANGWPQAARNAALREIRKCFAFHIAGDQHLPAIVHYGIDTHQDAGIAFAGPTVNNLYPRWFEPSAPGANRPPGAAETLGDFVDSFGHPLTVRAVANPRLTFRPFVLDAERDKSSGLGIVRFDKKKRTITIECWPFLADVTKPGTQYPGWPQTIGQQDNYARKPAAYLPTLEIHGVENPVVQVIEEPSGEIAYTLRIAGNSFCPPVFKAGSYTVKVSEPDFGRIQELRGLAAREMDNAVKIKVTL
jgi:hypothetical protein